MKASEAVHILKMIQGECGKQHMDSEAEALQMAIRTFSWTHENGQDSKKVDLIGRQAALDMEFSNGISEDGVLYVPYREVKMNLEELPSAQPKEVFEFDKTYPLAGLQVEITKGAYGDDFITIKRPERFLALDGVVYTQDDDRMVDMMPSAQPSPDEWCDTCKEYDAERHCCPRWNRVIRQTLREAQPERKVGKWIEEPNCYYRCSGCGEHYPSILGYMEYNFCPNCGARMVQEGEGNGTVN